MIRKSTFLKTGLPRSVPLLALALPLFFAACASNPRHAQRAIPQDHLAEIQRPDIPLVVNDRVQDWINYFQGPSKERFTRYLARSRKYIPMMRKILREHGLPENLVWLSMIESGFNPHAYSRASATGAWQFIYQTGIRYGLKTDSWVDERRDPEKSTVAAAKYLKDLYDRYNNWYLAAAGYNAGEGKIDRAIRKYATEDFWQLARGRYLKSETKDYVPKLIAAALIARDPDKYGFSHIPYEQPVAYEEVDIQGPADLRVIAKCVGGTYEDIKALNPELLHWVTPPTSSEYTLRIPHGTKTRFLQKYAALNPAEKMGEQTIKAEGPKSLSNIAREHDVPAVLLAAANEMSPDDEVKAGQSIVIPFAPPEGEEFFEKDYTRHGRGRGGGRAIAYRVRGGDSIAKISRSTGISLAALRRHNPHINWENLKKGQRLTLYASSKSYGKSRESKKRGTLRHHRSRGQVAVRSAKKSHPTQKVVRANKPLKMPAIQQASTLTPLTPEM